jgi:hypothetical protein
LDVSIGGKWIKSFKARTAWPGCNFRFNSVKRPIASIHLNAREVALGADPQDRFQISPVAQGSSSGPKLGEEA